MSWAEFTRTKCFGNGIFRPYADFMGDVAIQIDNLLSADPAFAKFVKPLASRDAVLVRGSRIAVVCVSSDAYRQYPLRSSPEWNDFCSISEDQFIAEQPGIDSTASLVDRNDLTKYLIESLNFRSPLCIGFPAIFIARRDSAEWQTRQRAVSETANIVVEYDRIQYEARLEMQRPKDIFLSHKSPDKVLVREVAATLRSVGLSPWLDEDRMKAGAHLERALRQGFHDSCAAVFFITPLFVDDGYLATEIDYASAEKRTKGDRFSIITLLIPGDDGAIGEVPGLLRTYVWKRVQPLEVVRTIVEALPIVCGAPKWRV